MDSDSKSWIYKLDAKILQNLDSFVADTWHQWEKDVNSCGLKILNQHPENASQCYEFIREFISHQNLEKLQQILYRVDVPESLIQNEKPSESFYQNITNLIIHREAMKVYFRKYHTF